MDDAIKYVAVLFTIIQQRRAAGFPIAKELVALFSFVMNPRTLTADEWVEHNKAQEDSRALRRNAKPAGT